MRQKGTLDKFLMFQPSVEEEKKCASTNITDNEADNIMRCMLSK
jgi:hypothetical protein